MFLILIHQLAQTQIVAPSSLIIGHLLSNRHGDSEDNVKQVKEHNLYVSHDFKKTLVIWLDLETSVSLMLAMWMKAFYGFS